MIKFSFRSYFRALLVLCAVIAMAIGARAVQTGAYPDFPFTIVTVAPYAYTPLTPGQHNLAPTSATALTVPTGATSATIVASTAIVRYTTDGTTTPTGAIGMPIAIGGSVTITGATALANFKAFSSTGTLDVEYFK